LFKWDAVNKKATETRVVLGISASQMTNVNYTIFSCYCKFTKFSIAYYTLKWLV